MTKDKKFIDTFTHKHNNTILSTIRKAKEEGKQGIVIFEEKGDYNR